MNNFANRHVVAVLDSEYLDEVDIAYDNHVFHQYTSLSYYIGNFRQMYTE